MRTAVTSPPEASSNAPPWVATEVSQRQEAQQRHIRELTDFAFMAAHDLEEPLRAVSGFLQLLDQRYGATLDPHARELLELAAEGAKRMQDLLDNALSAVLRDPTADSRRLTASADAVAAACGNLHQVIEQRRPRIRLGNLPIVLADPARLVRVFQNLIANAIRHNAAASPEILVQGEERARDWLFQVADNGAGLSARPAPGLGLQICSRIVERHGGRLWRFPSAQGAAVCFTLAKD